MSSSKTPCAACKLQRRKCTPECVFAPYFPPDIPEKFQNVHQIFGASNVSKILTDLDVAQREEAVKSLDYEAEARIKDPVYGCVGAIAFLQQKLRHLTNEIEKANKEIAIYEGTHGFQPFQLVPGFDAHHAGTTSNSNIVYGPSSVYSYNNIPPQAMASARGGGNLVIRDPQQQQLVMGDMELRQMQELEAKEGIVINSSRISITIIAIISKGKYSTRIRLYTISFKSSYLYRHSNRNSSSFNHNLSTIISIRSRCFCNRNLNTKSNPMVGASAQLLDFQFCRSCALDNIVLNIFNFVLNVQVMVFGRVGDFSH
ncbi:hypothetical protein K1719_015478 [Acacia pycnantha]|nr:hypothetical protein K1719_015478 [Acacia pycnantha]